MIFRWFTIRFPLISKRITDKNILDNNVIPRFLKLFLNALAELTDSHGPLLHCPCIIEASDSYILGVSLLRGGQADRFEDSRSWAWAVKIGATMTCKYLVLEADRS